MDLTAFGLEPRDSPANDETDEPSADLEEIWSECVDCGYAGYEVQVRRKDGVPLCPACFADREGLR